MLVHKLKATALSLLLARRRRHRRGLAHASPVRRGRASRRAARRRLGRSLALRGRDDPTRARPRAG